MARIEHRRYRRIRASEGGSPAAGELRRDPPPARRDEEPGAPDAWLDDLVAKLTWLGWLSLAGAAAYLVLNLGFLLDDGVLSGGRLLGTVPATLRVAGFGAMLALPAALELGGAGARVGVPRLMRGAVLLATAELVRLVVAEIQHRAFESDALALDPFDFENPVRLAFQMLGTVAPIVMIAGAWSLSVGLRDAGARPRRAPLVGAVVVVVAGSAALNLAFAGVPSSGLGLLYVFSTVVSLVLVAVLTVLAIRLMAGARALLPRRAWIAAGVAGGCQLAQIVLLTVASLWAIVIQAEPLDGGIQILLTAVWVAAPAVWVLLAIAFATGLGRHGHDIPAGGTDMLAQPRTPGTRRLVPRWVRYPLA